jgi:hypothetical protein
MLFWHPAGLKIHYEQGMFLHIEDLNPEAKIQFRMSRGEMFHLGFRCILAALKGKA